MTDEWQKTTLGHVLGKKGYIRGPFGSALKRAELHSSGIPVYEQQHAIYNTRAFRFFIDAAKYRELSRFTVQPNDLIISCSGTLGRISIIRENDPLGIISQALLLLRPDTTLVDPRFLFYALSSPAGYHSLVSVSSGSVQVNIAKRSIIESVRITLPPLSEQKLIANVLGTLDDAIELVTRMNQTLEAMARTIFKSWFVDFDPVRAKADGRKPAGMDAETAALFADSFEDSEIGGIPKGCDVRPVYECADYTNGSAFRPENFSPERLGLPVIKIAELKYGVTSQTKFTEEILEPRYRITSGDILFSWSGSPDTSIDTFVWTGGDGWLNQHIFKIQFKRPDEDLFVYYLLRHLNPVFVEIARNKQTTGLGHVTAQDLKRLKTVFPPNDCLRMFNRLVRPFFQRAYTNRCESRTLIAIRDSLLPKLLSGEIRAREAESLAVAVP